MTSNINTDGMNGLPELMSLNWSDTKGNGWICNSTQEPNVEILSEKPFALSLFTDQSSRYCSSCFKDMYSLSSSDITHCNECNSFSLCKNCCNTENLNDHKNICVLLGWSMLPIN